VQLHLFVPLSHPSVPLGKYIMHCIERTVSLLLENTVLGAQRKSTCKCHVWQKGGSNLERVSWKDPAVGIHVVTSLQQGPGVTFPWCRSLDLAVRQHGDSFEAKTAPKT